MSGCCHYRRMQLLRVNPRVFQLTRNARALRPDTERETMTQKIESLTSVFCRFLFILWSIIMKGHIWFESSFTHRWLWRPICSTHPASSFVHDCGLSPDPSKPKIPSEDLNHRGRWLVGIPMPEDRTMPSRGWGWYGTEGKSMGRLS